MNNADIELQHIWLEIQAQRWSNIGRFLFSYYCFLHGWVTKANKPCWETARRKLCASSTIQTRSQTLIEPLVPEDTVIGLLKSHSKSEPLSLIETQKILTQFLHYAVISKQEKQRLSVNMPAHWYHQDEKPLQTRFEQAGIVIKEQ
ncbi:hypothetical protein [Vibrio sp. CAU 1672]|uniref:hypothetical protein n=1 Tax=Vibrio sp. CAU 1672 TaxID=3032594 RepID=UPI0023DB1570|nr:hypothetical protein [Vibrio sp. CAU 1672]MDF2154665.1 hypothetical protein [Vibrio sp. CAU 1672]